MTTTTDRHLAPHADPERKQDFVFLFDVRDGNPNGDPDAGGMPRVDPETQQGLVTDVAIKRKIRNMVALLGEGKPGYDIYVEAGVALNAQHSRAYADLNLKESDGKPKGYRPPPADQARARQWMCETFYDVRMFGAVMATGTALCGRVQGPLQLTFSRSIDRVLAQEHGLTRDHPDPGGRHRARARPPRWAPSTPSPTACTVGFGHFSAPLAGRTGVKPEDLEMFWQAFTLMFEHDRSAARGEVTLRGLYVFSHADKFGSAAGASPVRPHQHHLVRAAATPLLRGLQDRDRHQDLPAGMAFTRVTG